MLPAAVRNTMEAGGVHNTAERRDIMAAAYDKYTKTSRSRWECSSYGQPQYVDTPCDS